MVLDVPMFPESPTLGSDTEDDLTIDFDKPRRKGLSRLHISHLLHMVLQDAQTRLFFKAQSVIQSDIRYYAAKPDDLAYPDRLIGELSFRNFVLEVFMCLLDARKPTSGFEIKEKESVSQLFQLPSLAKQDTWYPTLRKTIWVLSQLHDFVKVSPVSRSMHDSRFTVASCSRQYSKT
jgi:hypothetical protein